MRFRQELSARRPTLAASLEGVHCLWRDGELEIALAGDDSLATAQLARASNRELLDAAVVAVFGTGARWRLVARAAGAPPAAPAAAPAAAVALDPALALGASDPRVQTVLDIFEGSVAAVSGAAEEIDSEESE